MITLIRRVFSACLITMAIFLLIVIGTGGMLMDLLGAAASALISAAMVAAGCDWLEEDNEE